MANVLAAARERQNDEQRLSALAVAEQARAAQLKGVIESIGDAVVVCDALGSVVLSNPAADALLAGSPERRARRHHARVRLADRTLDGRAHTRRGHEVRAAQSMTNRRQVDRAVSFPGSGRRGRPAGAGGTILVMRDVTAARNARAVRDAFLGVLSHELRTPVTTIYGNSEILARKSASDMPEERRREVYDDIRSEADRLYRLVENLLVLVARRAPGADHRHGAGPAAAADPARRRVRGGPLAAASWRTELPANLPPVAAEETYIEQVLRNLLGNAAKYGGDGPVTIAAEDSGDTVTVRVADAGPGFPEDEVSRLFDLFYRSPTVVKRAAGAGIGLFVSRQLVNAMGGQMTARNRPEGGAEFAFDIPVFRS